MDTPENSELFYIGPVVGWAGDDESRVLVDVVEKIQLDMSVIVNRNVKSRLATSPIIAEPGIPVIYVLRGIPPGNEVELVWSSPNVSMGMSISFTVLYGQRILPKLESKLLIDGVQHVYVDYRSPSGRKLYSPRSSVSLNKLVNPKPYRVGVVSCNGYKLEDPKFPKDWKAWKSLLGDHPDIVLHIGDQVYLDIHACAFFKGTINAEELHKRIRRHYHRVWKVKSTQELLRSRPNIMVPDDHDYRNNISLLPYPPGLFNITNPDSANMVINIGGVAQTPILETYDSIARKYINIYQSILYCDHQDVPFDIKLKDESSHRFMFIDGRFKRTEEHYFDKSELEDLVTRITKESENTHVYILTQSSPFTIPHWTSLFLSNFDSNARDTWTYNKQWIEDFVELIAVMEFRKGGMIGGDIHIGQQVDIYNSYGDGIVSRWWTSSPISSRDSVLSKEIYVNMPILLNFDDYRCKIIKQSKHFNYLIVSEGNGYLESIK